MKTGLRAVASVIIWCAATAVTAGAAIASDAVPTTHEFAGTLYLADANTWQKIDEGTDLPYDAPVMGLPAPGDTDARFPIPPGAATAEVFISPRGDEADATKWNASSPLFLTDGGVWLPNLSPLNQATVGAGVPQGTNAVKTTGGDYSLGIAFLRDDGIRVVDAGLYFVHIHVTPGSGGFTWQTVAAGAAPDTSAPSESDTSAGSVAEGLLAFTVPASGTQLTVHGAQTATPGWTVTVAAGSDARALATGASGDTQVDVPAADAATVTITLVSG